MSNRRRAKSLDTLDADVGARVRSRRMQLGLSQSALANALGISFQQVQKYERGANRISCSRLDQIARVLEVEPQHFFADPFKERGALQADLEMQAINQFLSSKDGIDLMRAFVRIKSQDVKHIIATVVAGLSHIMFLDSLLL